MGVELLFNSVEFGSQSCCQQTPRGLETRCGREGHTQPRGTSETPDAFASRIPDSQRPDVGRPQPTEGALGKAPMEWTPRPLVEHLREQERHNVTVITVGSKYEDYVQSSAPSHMQTLKQPFQTLAIKREVKIFLKKSSCVLYSCVCRLSCVCYHCVGMYPVYICMQHIETCGCFFFGYDQSRSVWISTSRDELKS